MWTESLGTDDEIDKIRHVSRKDKNDWVKKCMDYEVEGVRPTGRPMKTWELRYRK